MDKELLEAMQRLTAAVPSEERRKEAFGEYLESWAKIEGHVLEEVTEAQKLELKPQFTANLMAEVQPTDIIAVCRSIKEPTVIVNELKKGSVRAKHVNADGTPRKVLIMARHLEHLLSLAAAVKPMETTGASRVRQTE